LIHVADGDAIYLRQVQMVSKDTKTHVVGADKGHANSFIWVDFLPGLK
jgi:hypothetical protein